MHKLSSRQWALLVLLTLVWGVNWPVMKLGVTGFPPLTYRMLSIWIGTLVLALVLLAMRVPFRVPRTHWPELLVLSVFNMFIWHGLVIVTLASLSSGRAAIVGYSMPIFSAVLGALFFGARLSARALAGVGAAALGVVLLLWHEFTQLSGSPWSVLLTLFAACTWALGTQLLNRTRIPVPTMTLSFWMTALTVPVLSGLAFALERDRWSTSSGPLWGSVLYNAVLIFGFAQAAWFYLARSLPPVASTLSLMMIPVVGVFSGAWWLRETLHWQDGAAMLLMVASIAAVLWPRRALT